LPMRIALQTALTLAIASQANAQPRLSVKPAAGVEQTATVGSTVIERLRYDAIPVAIAEQDIVRAVLWSTIAIKAGEPLARVQSRSAYKACSSSGPCALDDDGDGTFDRISEDFASGALKLKAPVRYVITDTPPGATGGFKQVLSYLGMSGDTIRFSYREFSDDMARPAFTEEFTVPAGKSFPQDVAIKDVRMTVIGIDGAGLRYRLEP